MKKYWWIVAIAGLAFWLNACGGQPKIFVAESNLDFGDVVNGEVIIREVSIENKGQADLVIEAVSTSCGCTQATIDPMTISPGNSGTLTIEFDSGAHGPDLTGQLIRQVFVATNDPDQPETVLELAANILLPSNP
ncbi:MAG: DUF1573 domain-containing protein [Ardenticatenaceae bacterium]|nr:DUF1573 domain-containing protein [Ardenticatenaceae bacterium]